MLIGPSRVAIARLAPLLWVAVVCGACEPEDELAPQVVTALPDGDGVGAGATGSYSITLRTDVCSGPCQYLSAMYGLTHYCQLGEEQVQATVTQRDGHLEISGAHLNPRMRIEQLEGGIAAGGAFEVGGFRQAPTLDVTMRVKGTVRDKYLTATGRARARRTPEGDCMAIVHWSGERAQ